MRYTVEVLTDVTYWYKEGTRTLHREDGPAAVHADGDRSWYIDGKLHRTDGPAIEWGDGSKSWYVEDKLHRIDGPAIETAVGVKYWYINGTRLTEQRFRERTAPVKELTVAEIEQRLGHRVKIVK